MCSPPPTRWQRPTHECYRRICAVVPVKDTAQRQAAARRRALRRAAPAARARHGRGRAGRHLASVPELAGIVVVTVDPAAAAIADRYGARISTDGAHDGQTGRGHGGGARLAGGSGLDLLTVPGDIPLVEPDDIRHLLSPRTAPRPPSRSCRRTTSSGSNAVLCSPPDAVPLRFGDNSFFPHLDGRAGARHRAAAWCRCRASRSTSTRPRIWRCSGATPSRTRARALLDQWTARNDTLAHRGRRPHEPHPHTCSTAPPPAMRRATTRRWRLPIATISRP